MAIEKDDKRAWDAMLREFGHLRKLIVTVGVNENAKPHTDDDGKEVMSMPMLAAIHEFGDAEIPERSFLRSTFEVRDDDWQAAMEKQMAKIARGSQTGNGAAVFLGVIASADVKKTILANIKPNLAPMTIAKRMKKGKHGGGAALHAGATTPLIDSGQLLASITFEVSNA